MDVEGQLIIVSKHYKATSHKNKGKWRRHTFKDMSETLDIAQTIAKKDDEDQLVCLVITEVKNTGDYTIRKQQQIPEKDLSALLSEREESQEIIGELREEIKRLKV